MLARADERLKATASPLTRHRERNGQDSIRELPLSRVFSKQGSFEKRERETVVEARSQYNFRDRHNSGMHSMEEFGMASRGGWRDTRSPLGDVNPLAANRVTQAFEVRPFPGKPVAPLIPASAGCPVPTGLANHEPAPRSISARQTNGSSIPLQSRSFSFVPNGGSSVPYGGSSAGPQVWPRESLTSAAPIKTLSELPSSRITSEMPERLGGSVTTSAATGSLGRAWTSSRFPQSVSSGASAPSWSSPDKEVVTSSHRVASPHRVSPPVAAGNGVAPAAIRSVSPDMDPGAVSPAHQVMLCRPVSPDLDSGAQTPVHQMVATCLQGHALSNLGTSRDDGWECDARAEPGACLNGITGLNQSAGLRRFRCELCAYDLCERCFRARALPISKASPKLSPCASDLPFPGTSTAGASTQGVTAVGGSTPRISEAEATTGLRFVEAEGCPLPPNMTQPMRSGMVEAIPQLQCSASERLLLTSGAAVSARNDASTVPLEKPVMEASKPQLRSASLPRAALCADPRGPSPVSRQVENLSDSMPFKASPEEASPALVPMPLKASLEDASPALVSMPFKTSPDDASPVSGPVVELNWSADWSIRLGSTLDGVRFTEVVKVLDKDAIFSVNQAVAELNRGGIQCREDLCLAFSASSSCWFLLFKNGRQELAAAALYGNQAEPTFSSSALGNGAAGPSQPALAAGAVVRIGGKVCQITTPLGMGSFGAVWTGELLDCQGGQVAVKEILCHTSTDLNNAAYEGKLLEILSQEHRNAGGASGSSSRPLGQAARADASRQGRIPALIASETEQLGPQHWRVRLAMSKVPGVSLDRFLDWWQRERRPPADVQSQPRQRFVEACHFATELISQLAPTFEHISNHAFHRDINSHNILIDGGEVLVPNYGLVDFGLAVDLNNWRGPNVNSSSWHLVDIGGDCRYWPMAAWLQFECGWQELAKYPALATEYQTHLDLHALGVTALQVWASMCCDAVHGSRRTAGAEILPSAADSEKLPEEVVLLLSAWNKYWQDATAYWEILLECFRNQGDQNSLKGWCISEGVHNTIGQDLADVRTALRMVCDACGSANGYVPNASMRGLSASCSQRPLFEALLELVSAGGVAGVLEGQRVTTWKVVRTILEPSDTANKGSMSVAITPGPPTRLAPAGGSMFAPFDIANENSGRLAFSAPRNMGALNGSRAGSSRQDI